MLSSNTVVLSLPISKNRSRYITGISHWSCRQSTVDGRAKTRSNASWSTPSCVSGDLAIGSRLGLHTTNHGNALNIFTPRESNAISNAIVERPLESWNLPSTKGGVVSFFFKCRRGEEAELVNRDLASKGKVWVVASKGCLRGLLRRDQNPPSLAETVILPR